MESIWLESVRRSLNDAVSLLDAVVNDCPDGQWQVPMWRVENSEIIGQVRDISGNLIADPVARDALVQRWSAPWSVAWHALEVLDYDLTGELEAWHPPPPFAGNPHWQTFTSLPAWSKLQIANYVDFCIQRVNDTFVDMTESKAASLLPATHRYAGTPYSRVVTALIGHTTAHATQIRQFSTALGPANAPY